MRSAFPLVVTALRFVPPAARPAPGQEGPPSAFRKGARILVQGDSITDGGRGRGVDPSHILGHGYAFLVAA